MTPTIPEPTFATARSEFHAALILSGVLSRDKNGAPSNADRSQVSSVRYATGIAGALEAETVAERLAGQTSGGGFEAACADFVRNTFNQLGHLRPGRWHVEQVQSRSATGGLQRFEQYEHLASLAAAPRELKAVLGNSYAIAPDIVVFREPEPDVVINGPVALVDGTVAQRAAIRDEVQSQPLLHAVISCKWTMRSDRAQNARSEALNLIRNRKGRVPHIVVVTGEPSLSRIASLALGTGDVDCVYHFALPELIDAVTADPHGDTARELLEIMVDGKRLRDIADLPLDLAV